MELVIICTVALAASTLTLFSGFGLGTLLMPAVAIFFPVEIAVAVTAVVHLANNLFKAALFARHADWRVVIRFGLPALVFAVFGAWILYWLSDLPAVFNYTLFGEVRAVMPVKMIVGLLILFFVFSEGKLKQSGIEFSRQWLPFGGVVSGFFGGLSGHQGAFRSLFLVRLGLTKEAYIATGVVLAVIVDVSRISVYGGEISQNPAMDWTLVGAATLSAFIGAFAGARLINKITIDGIHRLVTFLLVIVALGMMSGLL